MTETNQNISSPEQTPNPERDRVIRLIHNFYEEQNQNTPSHRQWAEIQKRGGENNELVKRIIDEKNAIAREMISASDDDRFILNISDFYDWSYSSNWVDQSACLNLKNRDVSLPEDILYIGGDLFLGKEDPFGLFLLKELQHQYSISDEELKKAQKIEWSELEKKNLQTLQQNAAHYKENWKDQKVELEGHQFSPSREAAMKQLLLGGFIEAEYDRLELPIVHKGRVMADILTGQFMI